MPNLNQLMRERQRAANELRQAQAKQLQRIAIESNAEQTVKLARRDAVSQGDIDNAERNFSNAKIETDQAVAEFDAARKNLEDIDFFIREESRVAQENAIKALQAQEQAQRGQQAREQAVRIQQEQKRFELPIAPNQPQDPFAPVFEGDQDLSAQNPLNAPVFEQEILRLEQENRRFFKSDVAITTDNIRIARENERRAAEAAIQAKVEQDRITEDAKRAAQFQKEQQAILDASRRAMQEAQRRAKLQAEVAEREQEAERKRIAEEEVKREQERANQARKELLIAEENSRKALEEQGRKEREALLNKQKEEQARIRQEQARRVELITNVDNKEAVIRNELSRIVDILETSHLSNDEKNHVKYELLKLKYSTGLTLQTNLDAISKFLNEKLDFHRKEKHRRRTDELERMTQELSKISEDQKLTEEEKATLKQVEQVEIIRETTQLINQLDAQLAQLPEGAFKRKFSVFYGRLKEDIASLSNANNALERNFNARTPEGVTQTLYDSINAFLTDDETLNLSERGQGYAPLALNIVGDIAALGLRLKQIINREFTIYDVVDTLGALGLATVDTAKVVNAFGVAAAGTVATIASPGVSGLYALYRGFDVGLQTHRVNRADKIQEGLIQELITERLKRRRKRSIAAVAGAIGGVVAGALAIASTGGIATPVVAGTAGLIAVALSADKVRGFLNTDKVGRTKITQVIMQFLSSELVSTEDKKDVLRSLGIKDKDSKLGSIQNPEIAGALFKEITDALATWQA